jgi:hypothetical protein
MARPITVVIDSNTTAAVDGIDKTAESVSNLDQILADLKASGHEIAPELIKSFLESERAATLSGEEIERQLTKSFGVPAEAAKRMADQVKGSLSDVDHAAEDTSGKFGDFKTNATDAVGQVGQSIGDLASGTGDVGDTLQSATALFAGFGAAGGVASELARGAISLVTKSIEEQQKQLDELKQKYSSAYKSAAQDGRDYLDEAQIIAGVQDDLFDDGKRNKATQDAKALHVDLITLLRAENGDTKALNDVRRQGTKVLKDQYEAEGPISRGRADQNRGLTEQDNKLRTILDTLEQTGKLQTENADAARLFAAYTATAAADAAKVKSAIAATPSKKTVTIIADDSDLNRKLSAPRSVTLRVDQILTRNGYSIR